MLSNNIRRITKTTIVAGNLNLYSLNIRESRLKLSRNIRGFNGKCNLMYIHQMIYCIKRDHTFF